MIVKDPDVRAVLEALLQCRNAEELKHRIAPTAPAPPTGRPTDEPTDSAVAMQRKFGMVDILDDSILNARQGDGAFPIRLMFGELTSNGDDDAAFGFACGLNFFFRASMGEEAKVHVGLEVSRLYYTFAAKHLEPKLRRALSPLLAQLMSTELSQLELRAVDDVPMFDSAMHERTARSDATSARIRAPASFLARVTGSGKTRFKATVAT